MTDDLADLYPGFSSTYVATDAGRTFVRSGGSGPPLVLSLALDPATQQRFDAERRAHFPPGRSVLGAHLTMFHALPAGTEASVKADLERESARTSFDVEVTGVRSLGRGVAYTLASPELLALRATLVDLWRPGLTRQDRQRFAPHVTVQNKVEPATAKALHAELSAGFRSWTARADALQLWRYVGGPWEPVAAYPFSEPRRPAPPS